MSDERIAREAFRIAYDKGGDLLLAASTRDKSKVDAALEQLRLEIEEAIRRAAK
jgi:hypothetical protein